MTVLAHARSATSLNTNSLAITAAGSFAYDLSTTAGFVDPTSVTTLYAPGSGGGYQAYFSIDEPAMYAVTAQLGHYALISLSSVQTGIVYQKVNLGTSLFVVNQSGVIPAGQYQIGASVGSGIPNLPDGINHLTDTGTLSDFTFSVNMPEPMGLSLLIGMAGTGCFVRRRR